MIFFGLKVFKKKFILGDIEISGSTIKNVLHMMKIYYTNLKQENVNLIILNFQLT